MTTFWPAGTRTSTDGSKVGYFAFDKETYPGFQDYSGSATHIIGHDMVNNSIWDAADGYASNARTDGPDVALFAMSTDGKTVLYPTLKDYGQQPDAKIIRQVQGGATTTVQVRAAANGDRATNLVDGDMSGDGNTVVYLGLDPSDQTPAVLKYNAQTNAPPSVAVRNIGWADGPRISRDGTTVAYYRYPSPNNTSDLYPWVKKLATDPNAPGIMVANHNCGLKDMSADGRYVDCTTYFYSGSTQVPPQSWIFDSFSTTSITSSMNLTSISDDASRSLGVQGDEAVWLQNYNVDQPNPDGCNQPDYGYIGQWERRTGIRVKLCNDAQHQLNFGGTNADEGILPPGWPIKNPPPTSTSQQAGRPSRSTPMGEPSSTEATSTPQCWAAATSTIETSSPSSRSRTVSSSKA